jgi:hypothetical protein
MDLGSSKTLEALGLSRLNHSNLHIQQFLVGFGTKTDKLTKKEPKPRTFNLQHWKGIV